MTATAESLELVRSLTDDEWAHIAGRLLTVRFPTARPDQIRPDGDWETWLIMAGRGWGKTRTGAEDVVHSAITDPGDYFVCAPTFRDMRAVCIEGTGSGVLAVLKRRAIPFEWNIVAGTVVLECGSTIHAGGAEEPNRWRGYNFKGGWCDELAAWRRPDTFVNLKMATRMGDARIVATTTPRPTAMIREMVEDPTVHVTRGRTMDNLANLKPAAVDALTRKYGGTRLGRQELEGELLTDPPGALWSLAMIDAERWADRDPLEVAAQCNRIVVAVDPAVTNHEDSDESGIVVVGRMGDQLVVLADATLKASPDGIAKTAVDLMAEFSADRIVAEVNNGGDWIGSVVKSVDRDASYGTVRAQKGKRVRAEPVAALYEQGRVHHVGTFPELEDQLCSWTPDAAGSPDRMDALVWACTDLLEARRRPRVVVRRAA